MITLPHAFCWTRFGVEAGEQMSSIFARKELERRTNAGTFFWGIGNPQGRAVHELAEQTGTATLVFSPIAGNAQAIDADPHAVIAWQSYVDDNGILQPLPRGTLVTSRMPHHGDMHAARHYALVCHRTEPIVLESTPPAIDIGKLVNFGSGRPVGGSQTTCVVQQNHEGESTRTYSAVLTATLHPPYAVRLADPTLFTTEDRHALRQAVHDLNAYQQLAIDVLTRRNASAGTLQPSLFSP
jgi:hypothetical protein